MSTDGSVVFDLFCFLESGDMVTLNVRPALFRQSAASSWRAADDSTAVFSFPLKILAIGDNWKLLVTVPQKILPYEMITYGRISIHNPIDGYL